MVAFNRSNPSLTLLPYIISVAERSVVSWIIFCNFNVKEGKKLT
jgi:hypothetical protein